jgi:YgiT-type zinc finger domain-containing protein
MGRRANAAGQGTVMKKTKCYFCGGELERRRVTAENWWGDSLALVENVPALVCRACDEPFFEPDVCRKLDELRTAPPRARKTMEVPVYAFSEA